MALINFDNIITNTSPHILEKICLLLDYESFKNCVEINKAWKGVLTSKVFQKKAICVFKEEILEDEKKLLRASEDGNAEEVARLLAFGMLDVDVEEEYPADDRDPRGSTPLLIAAKYGHTEVVKLLLDGGADPNKTDEKRINPLHAATFGGFTDVVKILLDIGAISRSHGHK